MTRTRVNQEEFEIHGATNDAVRVSWYGCNCDWLTKYCDEHHKRYALIPRDVLEQFELPGSKPPGSETKS